eukprot:Colp12_sorted_trinity150504_noHs@36531
MMSAKRRFQPEPEIPTQSLLKNAVLDAPDQLKLLVRMVVRAFYNNEFFPVIDLLVNKNWWREDELMDKLKVDKKVLKAVLSRLSHDRLLKSERRLEAKSADSNIKIEVVFWFLDY